MCGISGLFSFHRGAGQPEFERAVRAMTGLLARRGPDAEGFWLDPGGFVRLGFRRLAILDTSPAGNQPMISGDGRSVLVFNGEIYNFGALRNELEAAGVRFRSTGDAEVLLEALNLWGEDAVRRLNGMFAFAWYSIPERTLLLARDHAGIKPLYYFLHPGGQGLAFASQFDALLHTPWGEPGGLCPDVLHLYLRLHHIPPPFGLLENTHQLEPGHLLIARPGQAVLKKAWWSLPRDPEPDLWGERAVDALSGVLEEAVRRQRISDVPLGVFLSGGVDSPLVTAIARRQTGPDLKAFTIGSPGWAQDESEAATTYVRYLDVDHRLHPVSGEEALAAVADVERAQHEPFADFSILPTLLVSRHARKEVTVALSGDGGDELFFGYERPLSLLKNGEDFRFPWPLRLLLYGAGRFGLGPPRSDVIVSRTPGDYYFHVNSRLRERDLRAIAPDLSPPPEEFDLYDFDTYRGRRNLASYSRWAEYHGQLQRCLKKVDMASMRHSLEVRVPLLDREVIETSLRIDPFESMRNGTRKAVLRDSLARYVPPEIIPKGKKGFAVPLAAWLRGPLRSLAEETLFSGPLFPEGIFDRRAVRRYWEDHLSGRRDVKWGIWTLMALQWWARTHRVPAASRDV